VEFPARTVFALSIHADYRCHHSGACCAADWDVPVELPIYRLLAEAVAAGRLQPSPTAAGLRPFVVEPDVPEGAAAVLERTCSGDCVFFERGPNLCIVHRKLGPDALPATCRYFPRIAVRDPRGTFITLSHYCPTAASLLFRDDVDVEIVENPPAFPPADYEGLVVGPDDLPPLLHPRMLMDYEGYSAWERHMVRVCAATGQPPESVVATLARDARLIAGWKPGAERLAVAVERLPREHVPATQPEDLSGSLRLYAEVMGAVPDDLKPSPDEDGLDAAYAANVRDAWSRWRAPVNRYLAAKAFASWTAYQGRGVAAIVRGLEAALALVRVEAARQCRDAGRPLDRALLLEAFRRADFVLNHLAVGEDLATAWSMEAG
jgi:Fe-S-cluster containining protein